MHRVQASAVPDGLLQLARDKNAGSVVVGRSGGNLIRRLSGGSTVDRLLRGAKDVDVHVVARGEES